MNLFEFIQNNQEIDKGYVYHTVPISTQNETYEATLKFYKYPQFTNGEYDTILFPNKVFQESYMYIRKKGSSEYMVFKYKGNVSVRKELVGNFMCIDVLNMAEIENDLRNEWSSLRLE